MKFLKPYEVYKKINDEYIQADFDVDFELEKENEQLLIETGLRNIQDDLNLHKDFNAIYSVIDKFQNANAFMSQVEESVEFMKKTGLTPAELQAGDFDVANLPTSLQELIATGATLKQLMESINEKDKAIIENNKNMINEANKAYANMSNQTQNQTEEQQEKVGN